MVAQVGRSFYVFCFNLPYPLSTLFATFGGYWLLHVMHKCELGLLGSDGKFKRDTTVKEGAELLAMSAGPGAAQTNAGQYPEGVRRRVADHGMSEKIRIYREGLFGGVWEKSIETVVALSEIPASRFRVGSGSSDNFLDSGPPGRLKAPATILYGGNDLGFDRRLALDGISDYLGRKSQVVFMEEPGHWLPCEEESREVLKDIVQWAMGDESSPLKQELTSGSAKFLVDQ